MSSDEIELYLSGLHNPEKDVRAKSMEQLVKLGIKAVPQLLDLLTDDDWVIRYRAAEALGGIRDTATIDSLTRLTADQKDHVRYMATKALGQMQDQRVVPTLIRMLSDDHSYTRKIAAGGLGTAGDPVALISLQKAIECESDPDVREHLLNAVEAIKK